MANGRGIFNKGDSSIEGVFENGSLISGEVENLPLQTQFHNQTYAGYYTGKFNNAAKGKGKFDLIIGKREALLEGEFSNNIITSGMVFNYPIKCKISEIDYDGLYSGEVINGDVTGKGEFKTTEIDYIGEMENGILKGKGKLKNSTLVVPFK